MLNHLRDEGILSRNPLAYTNTYGPTGGYRKPLHIRKASPIHNEILIHTVLLVVIEKHHIAPKIHPITPIYEKTGRYTRL